MHRWDVSDKIEAKIILPLQQEGEQSIFIAVYKLLVSVVENNKLSSDIFSQCNKKQLHQLKLRIQKEIESVKTEEKLFYY